MNQQQNNFSWVILEAMGHNVVSGRYLFENGLHRVDIPDVSPEAEAGRFIRSEWYGPSSIFRITAVNEETARMMAGRCVIPEAIPWDMRGELKKLVGPGEPVQALPEPKADFEQEYEDIALYGDDMDDYQDDEEF